MKVLPTAFAALDGVDAFKKTKGAYDNSSNNKYDSIMGTKLVKTTSLGGVSNAINGRNNEMIRQVTASDMIDSMYMEKEASIAGAQARIAKGLRAAQNGVKSATAPIKKHVADPIKKHVINPTKSKVKYMERQSLDNFKKAKSNVAKGKDKEAIKNFGKGMAYSAPAIAGMGAVSVGSTKTMEHFENKKKREDRNEVYPKLVGAGIGAAMLTNALVKGNAYNPLRVAAKTGRTVVSSIPKDALKKSGPVGGFAADVMKQSKGKLGKFIDKQESIVKNKDRAKGAASRMNKTSFEIIDEAYAEKIAGAKTDYVKKVAVNNFFKEGVKSLPYIGATAIVSRAIGKDLRRGGNSLRKDDNTDTMIIEVPLQKKASFDPSKIKRRGKDVAKMVFEQSATGLGRTVIPTTASIVIGKNIMDNMADMDKNNHLDKAMRQDIGDGNARIIIQTKRASDEIDGLMKIARINKVKGIATFSEVKERIDHDTGEAMGYKPRATAKKVKLTQHQKKKGRMFE